MSAAFTQGQHVYATDGRFGSYVAPVADGHIVRPGYEDGDGVTETASFYFEGAEVWPVVHAEAPRPKLDADIAAAEERLQRLRMEVQALENAKRVAQCSQAEVLVRLKQHQALKHIEMFLDGMTPPWFLELHEYREPRIVTATDALKVEDRYSKGTKLMCLFGKAGGDFMWGVHRYSDGSGSSSNWVDVIPFASEEEAVAELRRLYSLHVADWRAEMKRDPSRVWGHKAISWASLTAWLEVPEDVAAHIKETNLKVARAAFEKADLERIKASAALRELTGQPTPAEVVA